MLTDDQLFSMIADRRIALADELDTLTASDADVPSLCGKWTTLDVATHLTMPFKVAVPQLVLGILKNKGDFNAYSAKWSTNAARSCTFSDNAAVLRANANHRFTPPRMGPVAPLTDIIVHTHDILVPLDRRPDMPSDQLVQVLEGLAHPSALKGFAPKGILDGIHFVATDLDWQHGTGDDVSGPSWALILVMTGRAAGLAHLTGSGESILRSRIGLTAR